MSARIVCSVMVYSYNTLVKRCEGIDKTIYNTAVHSARKNTWDTYKDIENLTNEKIAYINTKVVVDQALATMRGKRELEMHHVQGLSYEDIATKLGEDQERIRCRIESQRRRLYDNILELYSGEELLGIISGSEWLLHKYNKAIKSKTENTSKKI